MQTTEHGSTALLTPVSVGEARPVDNQGRKFRKLLLPRRRIEAGGRVLDLASYFPSLIKAEKDQAFDAIALQVHEKHTKNPKYTEGGVSNLAHEPNGPDGDGLYGDVEFADDEGVNLVRKSLGKVGVSVSMVQNLERVEDGKRSFWPAALQHVLMTTDPEVRGMGGWHPINLGRTDVTQTIDLSNQSYDEMEEPEMTAPTQTPAETSGGDRSDGSDQDGNVTLTLPREDADALTEFLSDLRASKSVVGRGSDDTGAPAGAGSPDLATAGATTNLSRGADEDDDEDDDRIELMRSELETERNARIELTRELQRSKAAREIEQLGDTGLAPAIIDAARPLLEVERGTGAIELSRDSRGRAVNMDPTQVIREVLHQVIELSRNGTAIIDLDREEGLHIGEGAEDAGRRAKLNAWAGMFPDE